MSLHAASIYYTLSPAPKNASPVILLHGAGGSRLSWHPLLRRLGGRTVYTLDLPGHGRSTPPACDSIAAYAARVAAWMQALNLPPAVIVGHSMGSAIALTLALDYADRVRSLILIGSGARLRVHPSLLEWTKRPETLEQAIQTLLEWGFGPNAPQALKDLAAQHMRQTPPATFHADFLACDRFDIRDRLAEIAHPTLLLCGTEDRMTPPRFSEFLAENLPHAQLQRIEAAGHMLMLEQPQAVKEAVHAFLQSQS